MGNLSLRPKKNHKGDSKSCLSTLRWSYEHQAKRRGLTFELTKEQFAELTKQDCWYCGREPAQIKRDCHRAPKGAYYIYNGIDRIDNAVGYTEANCIPCCGKCNWMKGTLHAEDFIVQIRKIGSNLNIFPL